MGCGLGVCCLCYVLMFYGVKHELAVLSIVSLCMVSSASFTSFAHSVPCLHGRCMLGWYCSMSSNVFRQRAVNCGGLRSTSCGWYMIPNVLFCGMG